MKRRESETNLKLIKRDRAGSWRPKEQKLKKKKANDKGKWSRGGWG